MSTCISLYLHFITAFLICKTFITGMMLLQNLCRARMWHQWQWQKRYTAHPLCKYDIATEFLSFSVLYRWGIVWLHHSKGPSVRGGDQGVFQTDCVCDGLRPQPGIRTQGPQTGTNNLCLHMKEWKYEQMCLLVCDCIFFLMLAAMLVSLNYRRICWLTKTTTWSS